MWGSARRFIPRCSQGDEQREAAACGWWSACLRRDVLWALRAVSQTGRQCDCERRKTQLAARHVHVCTADLPMPKAGRLISGCLRVRGQQGHGGGGYLRRDIARVAS